jgi:hypothetical protein
VNTEADVDGEMDCSLNTLRERLKMRARERKCGRW